jgi:hypothetical protein
MNTSTGHLVVGAIALALAGLAWGCKANSTTTTTLPATGVQKSASLENRKIWNRSWNNVELQTDKPLTIPLRFSFAPSRETWQRPGGSVEPATGTDQDITAAGYDVIAQFDVGRVRSIEIKLCGRPVRWDRATQTLDGQPLPSKDGKLAVRLIADQKSFRVLNDEGRPIITSELPAMPDHPELAITATGEAARVANLEIFGLRSGDPTPEESRLAAIAAADHRVFYRSHSYTVYGSRVEDDIYGPPAASVPDANTIVSPTRVIEGFEVNLDRWRPHPQGRVVDHQAIWHPSAGIARFPQLKTSWPTVDAAYRVAVDVLHRSSTDEFISNPDDRGKWQAGFFMGKTFGFGIWMRDSTHIALRAGNMIDPKIARNTLIHITKTGIDNGCDGVLMPIVGLWDYYLVTGDQSALRETWSDLKEHIAKIDAQFDPDKGLVKAAHSTSNDAFPEPEAGGFSLGTEAYFMLAYEAMADIGAVMHEDRATVQAWRARGELLRANIQKLYWKESAGFFTTGPSGSDGYANDFWESAGEELAIWPRFRIASPEQRRRVLDRLPQVAMNEFGVDVFPYRPETNHFCGAGWVVWTAGIAAAANREGRLDLLQHLIGQQVRNAVTNKTFYEVIDVESGRAWRWPGQLWQAAGFLSYVYNGVLGMEFTEQGLKLNAAVPETLADMRVSNFAYRGAILDIKVSGWGTAGEMYLDGEKAEIIPTHLTGRHLVELRVTPRPSDLTRVPVTLQSGRLPLVTKAH